MKRQPSPPWDGGALTNEPETLWIWGEIGRDNCSLKGGGAQSMQGEASPDTPASTEKVD